MQAAKTLAAGLFIFVLLWVLFKKIQAWRSCVICRLYDFWISFHPLLLLLAQQLLTSILSAGAQNFACNPIAVNATIRQTWKPKRATIKPFTESFCTYLISTDYKVLYLYFWWIPMNAKRLVGRKCYLLAKETHVLYVTEGSVYNLDCESGCPCGQAHKRVEVRIC